MNEIDPFFLFGELNMDLKSKKGDILMEYLNEHQLKNFVKKYTRIQTVYFKQKKGICYN